MELLRYDYVTHLIFLLLHLFLFHIGAPCARNFYRAFIVPACVWILALAIAITYAVVILILEVTHQLSVAGRLDGRHPDAMCDAFIRLFTLSFNPFSPLFMHLAERSSIFIMYAPERNWPINSPGTAAH